MSSVLKAPSSTVPTIGYLLLTSAGAQGGVPPDIRWPIRWTYVSFSPFRQEKKKKKRRSLKKKITSKTFPFSSYTSVAFWSVP